ncbi:MAG: DUF624 domain-containing protein [Clostridia bacterium]|nr:DUF624 domain-containing protein [Clostridia bacterium]
MAGFFGLFDYTKEGPGVPKNAPKKKTFVVFFETFFRNFWKFITINIVYSLISIPLVTNGLANVGLANVVRNTARDKHSFGLSDFFDTIRKNFKQSLIAGIINTLLYAILFFDLWFFRNVAGTPGIIATGLTLALLFTFIMMNFYLWTLIITFSYSLKQAYSVSFKLTFLNFKYSFLIAFVNILLLAATIGLLFITGKSWIYVLIFELLLLVTVYPAFNGLLIQFCIFPSIKKFIIDPYYKEHPNEDIEKRQSLGLEIEEQKKIIPDEVESGEDVDGDDSIFND